MRRVGADRLQELGDDIVEAADLPFGHFEILFEFIGYITGFAADNTPCLSAGPDSPAR